MTISANIPSLTLSLLLRRPRRPRLLLLPPPSKRIRQSPTHHLRRTQPQSSTPHNPPRPKFTFNALFPPQRKEHVEPRPGSGNARGIDGETVDVHPAGEEEDGREEHGEGLEGFEVLGCC